LRSEARAAMSQLDCSFSTAGHELEEPKRVEG